MPVVSTINSVVSALPSIRKPAAIRCSPLLAQAAAKDAPDIFQLMDTSAQGISEEHAAERIVKHGPNEVGQEKKHGWLWRLMHTLQNPLVILLSILAIISFSTGDTSAGVVMVLMVILGV